MTSFLLMRHAEPDFSDCDKRPGWGSDLAPLTPAGEDQVISQMNRIIEFNPEIVISSPMTRAMHSALLVRSEVDVPFKVEFNLHEWMPDRSFKSRSLENFQACGLEFYRLNGEWPKGETRCWEPLSAMRLRALMVLRKYLKYQRVLIICHGKLIKSLTTLDTDVDFAGFVNLELIE
jgi:broad specificity phosphatase PhoE